MEALKNFFVIDQKTGKISHTKLYSNLGYIAVIGTFVFAVVTGGTIDPTLLMMFGAVVIGNRSALKIANILKQSPIKS